MARHISSVGLAWQPGYRRFDGTMPLLLIAAVVESDERNEIILLEASACFEPAIMAAANTSLY